MKETYTTKREVEMAERILKEVDKALTLCEDPKCPEREECDTANHHISQCKVIFEAIIKRIIK